MRDIVGVHARDDRSCGYLGAAIRGHHDAAVRQIEDAQSWVSHAAQTLKCLIGRPVVNDDQLEIVKALLEDGASRANDRCGAVVDGEDDGDLGHGGKLTASVPRVRGGIALQGAVVGHSNLASGTSIQSPTSTARVVQSPMTSHRS